MKILKLTALLFIFAGPVSLFAQKDSKPKEPVAEEKSKTDKNPLHNSATFSAFKFRSIGPSMISGRIIDLAVNPKNKSQYYIAAACGGVWKTNNNGITFDPIFDGQGSFSIGCLALDPTNPNIVWVGSG